MPRSNWSYIFAVVGCPIIGLGYLGYRDAEIDPYPDAHYQPARRPSFPPGWPHDYNSKAGGYEPNCEKPSNKDDSDLCAQWSAVEAVNETNRLSRISLNVSALEFGGLALSLIFTGWAAWAAAVAAKAAKTSIAVTQDASKTELRAYINSDTTQIVIKPTSSATDEATTDIVFKNFGSTPAHAVRCEYTITLRDRSGDQLIVERESRDYGSVGPSTKFSIRKNFTLMRADEHIPKMKAGEVRVLISALVKYKTVFDELPEPLRETEAFLINGPVFHIQEPQPLTGFHMMADGSEKNRST